MILSRSRLHRRIYSSPVARFLYRQTLLFLLIVRRKEFPAIPYRLHIRHGGCSGDRSHTRRPDNPRLINACDDALETDFRLIRYDTVSNFITCLQCRFRLVARQLVTLARLGIKGDGKSGFGDNNCSVTL